MTLPLFRIKANLQGVAGINLFHVTHYKTATAPSHDDVFVFFSSGHSVQLRGDNARDFIRMWASYSSPLVAVEESTSDAANQV